MSSGAEYRQALEDLSADDGAVHVIEFAADFGLSNANPDYWSAQKLTIDGNGHTVDGQGLYPLLFVRDRSAVVDLRDLHVQNTGDRGSAGAAVHSRGGPVTATRVTFTNGGGDSAGAGSGIAQSVAPTSASKTMG